MSCAGKKQTVVKTEYIYLTPPKAWIVERNIDKDMTIKTNEDLLDLYLDAKEIIELHNKDKQLMQTWIDTIPSNSKIERTKEDGS